MQKVLFHFRKYFANDLDLDPVVKINVLSDLQDFFSQQSLFMQKKV